MYNYYECTEIRLDCQGDWGMNIGQRMHYLLFEREMGDSQVINSDILFYCHLFKCPLLHMFKEYVYLCIILPFYLWGFGSL